jgi:predicted nucleotidyltransferase
VLAKGDLVTTLLEERTDEIGAACRRHGVRRLDVFGSILAGDFRAGESDVDLLVESSPMEPYARVKAYFALRDELEEMLGVTVS